MTTRKRLIITVTAVCHAVLAPALLTCQEQPRPVAAQAAISAVEEDQAKPNPTARLRPGEPVTIQADSQEAQGDVYQLRGNVEIRFRDYTLKADEMVYNDNTGEISATGHVVLDGGPNNEHLSAARGSYNRYTEFGSFYDVVGTTGAKMRGKNVVLTSSTPFSFVGQRVDVEGRSRIVVHHGVVTSCNLPRPHWWFRAEHVSVVAGEDAKIYNSSFWLFRVPLFYFPFLDHPVERVARKSGFLLPTIGQSSRKGFIFGDSFFWAINRSMDATVGAEYYSKRGWAQHGQFRARLTEDSSILVQYFGVLDRGLATTSTEPGPNNTVITVPAHTDQGGQELRAAASGYLAPGLRGVADIDYLSSYRFRAAFSENYSDAINSEVRSALFLTKNWRGYSFSLMTSRYQNFANTNVSTTAPETVETIVHAPTFQVSSSDRQLGSSPVYWGFDAAAEGLSRREPNFVTANVVGRYDIYPHFSLPLHWHDWNLRPEIALRDTWYGSQLISGEGGVRPGETPINRRAFQAAVELRPPALGRIFDRTILSNKIKHVIEPRVIYRYTNGVENFSKILRFDERDILSNTNEVEYGIVNRLYSKHVGSECANASAGQESDRCSAQEIVSWELAQKYFLDPKFGGALITGQRNVFTTTEELTGIAFASQPRSFSPLVSRLRMRAQNTDVEWQLDYDTNHTRINSSTTLLEHRFGNFHVGGGHAFLSNADLTSQPAANQKAALLNFDQFRILTSYGNPGKSGLSAGVTIGFDANRGFLQYSAAQTTYNWDCCGITVEYRRFALGSLRNENQFRFALSLSNVGTFGTLRKQERLF